MEKLKMLLLAGILAVSPGLFSINTYAASSSKLTAEHIIESMVNAVNPGGKKLNDIKSIVMESSAQTAFKGKTEDGKMVFSYKFPDKYLLKEINTKGKVTYLEAYNGEKGWTKYLSKEPIAIIDKNKKESDQTKFNLASSNPVLIDYFDKYFSSFALAGTNVEVGKYSCYKIICKPKFQYIYDKPATSIIYYVDHSSFLPRKIEILSKINHVTVFPESYKLFSGMNIATKGHITSITKPLFIKKTFKSKYTYKVDSVKCNVKLNDSIFASPESPDINASEDQAK